MQVSAAEHALEPTSLAVDHIGIVVHDLARAVAAWRARGFSVSAPVPLMGRATDGTAMALGQSSAHIVFENGYVELSSPVPGSGNHLEPYLARGEGVRILVLATADATATRNAIAATAPHTSVVRAAERSVDIDGKTQTARFSWFPLPQDVLPGVLSAVVQHLTPELVFHPSFVNHRNGLSHIRHFVASGDRARLAIPAGLTGHSQEIDAPRLLWAPSNGPPAVDRMALAAARDSAEHVFNLAVG